MDSGKETTILIDTDLVTSITKVGVNRSNISVEHATAFPTELVDSLQLMGASLKINHLSKNMNGGMSAST